MTRSSLNPPRAEITVHTDHVCGGCGCLCDDIQVQVATGRVVAAENACAMGRNWFQPPQRPVSLPACWIDGQAAERVDGIDRAAMLLRDAHLPLVFGARDAGTETARAAIALADRSGASVDFSAGHFPAATIAMQRVGMVTATLGEVRQRADLVVFWGSDPATTHPRHFERYSLPDGRKRASLVVDHRETESARVVDRHLRIRPGSDAVCFQVLRALLQGQSTATQVVREQTGVSVETWEELAHELSEAKYGVLFLGESLATSRGRSADCQAAFQLIRTLNQRHRFVCIVDRSLPAAITTEQVMTWQCGIGTNVNLSAGYPRDGSGAWTAERLLHDRQADVAILVGDDAVHGLSESARQQLSAIPCIEIGPLHQPATFANVTLPTARNGLETRTTWYRMDQVPLVAHPIASAPFPSEAKTLRQIEFRMSM